MIFLKVIVIILLFIVIIQGIWVWRGIWLDMRRGRDEDHRKN